MWRYANRGHRGFRVWERQGEAEWLYSPSLPLTPWGVGTSHSCNYKLCGPGGPGLREGTSPPHVQREPQQPCVARLSRGSKASKPGGSGNSFTTVGRETLSPPGRAAARVTGHGAHFGHYLHSLQPLLVSSCPVLSVTVQRHPDQ
uniref:Uncharacterized protein n=1 Tax=Molossus molossus TaxID=27622 RepID=A0A7J8J011_MOLMO|nr:hypothetical protein HJG59_010253 [Molossus molossus]